jgi:hypothetical protein
MTICCCSCDLVKAKGCLDTIAPLSVLCKPVGGCCTIAQELPELLTLTIAGLGGEKPEAITPIVASTASVRHVAPPTAMLA